MSAYQFDEFISFTLAIVLLFLGKGLIGRIELLRRYSIPEPVIGGPIARYLITKHRLATSSDTELDIGVEHAEERTTKVDSYGILWAWLWLNVTLGLGYELDKLLQAGGLKLPLFVSCLIVGIVLGNLRNLMVKRDEVYPGSKLGTALISDISLGMFRPWR